MTPLPSSLATRLAGALVTSRSSVPLLSGACGMGRTSLLLRLRQILGHDNCQYIDIERVATTPERFLNLVVGDSPFRKNAHPANLAVKGPREAFDASLAFFSTACTADGRPATFLLDEVLDLRTFESFPGLRTVMADLVRAIEHSPNRFVLATRFAVRAARLQRESNGCLELHPLPRLSVAEVKTILEESPHRLGHQTSEDELALTVHALTDGRPRYVRALVQAISSMTDPGGADPVGALVSLLTTESDLSAFCRFSYELRLHRARGYGALKGILAVLAEEEPLTLTAISHRLMRTPGSTKDYLGWLEDVDLVTCDRKRYRIADPVMRLWIRVNARSSPPTEDIVVGEIQRYAMLRLAMAARGETGGGPPVEPAAEPAAATPQRSELPTRSHTPEVSAVEDIDAVGAGVSTDLVAGRQRSSGIVEFD